MEEVRIVERKEETIGLELSKEAKTFSIPHAMATAFGAIEKEIAKKKLKAGTAVYTRYREVDWIAESKKGFFSKIAAMFTKVWKMDMGVEVPDLTEVPEGFKKGSIQAGSYLEYKHIGPYSKLGQAYKKITNYILEHHIDIDTVAYDIYLNDPEKIPRSQLETLILVKIKS